MNIPKKSLTTLLHLEGLTFLITALFLYASTDISWWWFAGLLLAPDLAFVFYVISPKIGARAYNAVHTYLAVGILFALGYLSNSEFVQALSFIWLAHIGMDRTVGYGLKSDEGFKITHLQQVR